MFTLVVILLAVKCQACWYCLAKDIFLFIFSVFIQPWIERIVCSEQQRTTPAWDSWYFNTSDTAWALDYVEFCTSRLLAPKRRYSFSNPRIVGNSFGSNDHFSKRKRKMKRSFLFASVQRSYLLHAPMAGASCFLLEVPPKFVRVMHFPTWEHPFD